MIPYEDRFDLDRAWGWDQAGRHFHRDNDLFQAMRRVARWLGALGIAYAVTGAMAMFEHGHRRFTTSIDLHVTPDGLRALHDRAEQGDYVLASPGRKAIREAETGVRINFLVAGDYPGSGKPCPVPFPDPADVGEVRDGVAYLNLATLVELKLASSLTGGPHRQKDLADVIALITTLNLPADLAGRLNPFVRDRYVEYWTALQEPAYEQCP